MIYTQKGFNHPNMTPTSYQDFPGLLEDYNSPTVSVSKDNVASLKSSLEYVYSGELKDNRRTTESVIYRDLIALDLDNIEPSINTPDKLLNVLVNSLGGLNFILYPTIKNGLEEYGLRYRLLIEAPPLLPETYTIATKGFMYWLLDSHIITNNWDESTARPTQLFSLPVRNQFTKGELVTYHQGDKLTTDSLKMMIPEFKRLIADHEEQSKPLLVVRHHKTKYGAALMNKIITGIPQGDRNNTMNKFIFHWLRQGITESNMKSLVEVINTAYFHPPLSDREVSTIFQSAKSGARKRG